jgi:hypothetical protein
MVAVAYMVSVEDNSLCSFSNALFFRDDRGHEMSSDVVEGIRTRLQGGGVIRE